MHQEKCQEGCLGPCLGDILALSRWFLGLVLALLCWCLTDALVMFQYVSMLSGSCRADVSIMLGDVAVLSRRRLSGVPVVSWWCFGDVSVLCWRCVMLQEECPWGKILFSVRSDRKIGFVLFRKRPRRVTMWWRHEAKRKVTLIEVETNTFSVDPSMQGACMAARSIQESQDRWRSQNLHFQFDGKQFSFHVPKARGSPAGFVAAFLPDGLFALMPNDWDQTTYCVVTLWFGSQCRQPKTVFGQVFEACLRASLCGWRHGRRRILRSSRRSCSVGEGLWRGVGENAVCLCFAERLWM